MDVPLFHVEIVSFTVLSSFPDEKLRFRGDSEAVGAQIVVVKRSRRSRHDRLLNQHEGGMG